MLRVEIHHLLHNARLSFHHVIRQDHGKRLLTHHWLRAQYRMPQTQGLDLPDVDAGRLFRQYVAHGMEQVMLGRVFELDLELVGLIEVVLDRPLVAPGDEHEVSQASRQGLLGRILHDGLVDDG